MRYISLLFATLLTVACGNGTGNHDPLRLAPFMPPAISTLTPDSAPVDSVSFAMTVSGSNFGTDAVVFWNGVPLRTRFVASNQVLATISDTDLMFAGLAHVYVRTGGLNSNTVDFNVSLQ